MLGLPGMPTLLQPVSLVSTSLKVSRPQQARASSLEHVGAQTQQVRRGGVRAGVGGRVRREGEREGGRYVS